MPVPRQFQVTFNGYNGTFGYTSPQELKYFSGTPYLSQFVNLVQFLHQITLMGRCLLFADFGPEALLCSFVSLGNAVCSSP